MYIMKKLNREKSAATEERKKELEAQGYQCIGRKNDAGKRDKKPDDKPKTEKNSGKNAKTGKDAGAGDDDGSNGADNAGKN